MRHTGVIADPVLGNGGAVVIAVLIERDCIIAPFLEDAGIVSSTVLAHHHEVFPAEFDNVGLVGVTLWLR